MARVKKIPSISEADEDRFWNKVDRGGVGCWPWLAYCASHNGYGMFRLKRKLYQAHRVAWEVQVGPIPTGSLVLHRCDVPACVREEHLFLGTQRQNILDCKAKGRIARGDAHGSRLRPEARPRGSAHVLAKMTEEKVREIRRRYVMGGVTMTSLAKEFDIAKSTVQGIVHRRSWAHV